jgi:hypothetical protein
MASEHIKRNTYYTFVFNLSDAESVHAACLHLQLDARCQRLLCSLLPGNCVFRQTQASWNNAMFCRMDFVAPARNIGPIKYEPHPYVPAIPLSQAPNVIAELNAAVEEYKKAIKRQTHTQVSDSNQIAMQLLKLRAENPYAPVARLFEKLGKIRFQTQITIREELEQLGFAEFEEIRIGRSNMLLMDMTAKGYEATGFPIPNENKGRGTLAHRHFAHWIKLYFESKGNQAYIEFVLPGTNHAVDVAVKSGNKWKCFEICVTAFENVLSHIQACFEDSDDVESLTFIVATKTKLKELKELIQSDPIFISYADKIAFDVIENYTTGELKRAGD